MEHAIQTLPAIVQSDALRVGVALLVDFFLIGLLLMIGFLGVTFGLFLRRTENQREKVFLKLTEAEGSSDLELRSVKPNLEGERQIEKVS